MNRTVIRMLLIIGAVGLMGRTGNVEVGYQLGGGPNWLHVLLIMLGWIAVASVVASAFLAPWWLKALTSGLIVSLSASAAQATLSLAGVLDLNTTDYLAASLRYLIPTLLATGLGYAKGLADKKVNLAASRRHRHRPLIRYRKVCAHQAASHTAIAIRLADRYSVPPEFATAGTRRGGPW